MPTPSPSQSAPARWVVDRGRARLAILAALVSVLVVGLSGCNAMRAGNEQARAGDGKGYVAGDGSWDEFPVAKRGAPVVVAGQDTSGKPLSSEDFRGQVVVLNLWYAACGPCREEAPDLVAVAEATAPDGVQFIGIDTRDDPATAASFERTFGIPYPSIVDRQGDAVLALRGVATPNAVPTTIVLDRQGRVSARVSGRADPSILETLIASVASESA